MTPASSPTEPSFSRAQQQLNAVCAALDGVIVGQRDLVAGIVTAVFAGGHVLMEGLPGLGKTHLAKALAAALGLQWSREIGSASCRERVLIAV